MWYIKWSWTILVFVVLFTAVKGSCLEYGHSCWGAHGKRSGVKTGPSFDMADTHKQQPSSYADNIVEFTNRRNNNNNNDDEEQENPPLAAPSMAHSVEATARDDDAKLAQFLHQRQYQLKKLQQQQQQQEQQRNGEKLDEVDKLYENSAESWRKLLPFYGSYDLADRRAHLRKALLLQQLTAQRQQQQQQRAAAPAALGDLYELKK